MIFFIILEPVEKISSGSQHHLSNDFSEIGGIISVLLQIIHQGSEANSKRQVGHWEKNSKGHLYGTAIMILETPDQIVPKSPQSCEVVDNSVYKVK